MHPEPSIPPVSGPPDWVSEPHREYEAARRRAAVIAVPWRSLLSVRGRDAVGFLNGMLTQNLLDMTPGETRPACQVDRKGHLLADLQVLRLEDGCLLDAPAERVELLRELYEKHRILEKVRIEPMRDSKAVLLCGPESASVLAHLGEAGWPDRETPVPGFRIWHADVPELVARAVKAGTEPIGGRTLDRLRIEAGRARFGQDMDERHFPQEVGLEEAVHTSKGCYLGQETMARLHFRGHVNRRLCGVRIPGTTPATGSDVRLEGESVGALSSVAGPPGDGDSLGLLLLRIDLLEEGRTVEIEGERGLLEFLPFREARNV